MTTNPTPTGPVDPTDPTTTGPVDTTDPTPVDTTDPTTSAYVPPSTDDYARADRSTRARIRNTVTRAMRAAIRRRDDECADRCAVALDDYDGTGRRSVESTIDYPQLVANRRATLTLALRMLSTGLVVPTDVPTTDDDRPVTDGTTNVVGRADRSAAIALASARVAPTGRHNVGDGIATVVTDRFMTVREIAAAIGRLTPDDDYVPSDGAVAARLFPRTGSCTIPGVTPVPAGNGRSSRGAIRTPDES